MLWPRRAPPTSAPGWRLSSTSRRRRHGSLAPSASPRLAPLAAQAEPANSAGPASSPSGRGRRRWNRPYPHPRFPIDQPDIGEPQTSALATSGPPLGPGGPVARRRTQLCPGFRHGYGHKRGGQTFGRRARSWRRGAVTARFLPFDIRQFPADARSYCVGHVPSADPCLPQRGAGRKSGPVQYPFGVRRLRDDGAYLAVGLRQQSRLGIPATGLLRSGSR